jgi:hypothetical protein
LKIGWGVGIVIAILLSAVVYLVGIVNLGGLVSLVLLLSGLWTLVAAFTIFDRKGRTYVSGWGVVVAALSLFYFIPPNYTIALVLLAIVALIVINVYAGRGPKASASAANFPPPPGTTSAVAYTTTS